MKLSRRLHRAYARINGYFWLPCPVCREPFSGREWRNIKGHTPVIPDLDEPGSGTGICPKCTAAGVGCYVHARFGLPTTHRGCPQVEQALAVLEAKTSQ